MTNRLVFFYSVIAIGCLLLVSLFLYTAMTTLIKKANRQFLLDDLRYVASVIQVHEADLTFLSTEIEWLPPVIKRNTQGRSRLVMPYDYIRILDGKGKTLQETPSMEALLPASVFPQLKKNAVSKIQTWHGADGRMYWLIAGMTWSKSQGERIIQIALDVTSVMNMIARYRHWLVIFILISTLLIGLSVRFIAKQTLKPLREMSKKMGKIRVGELHRRLHVAGFPEELQSLAVSLNHMISNIESRYSRLERFSSELAHELRTPLNNLMGETEVALSKPRSGEVYRAILASNLEEYQHMTQLIDQMLLLSKIDNLQAGLSREQVSIKESVQSVLNYYACLAHEKNIEMVQSLEGTFHVNTLLWQRAFSNVIDNAIKYTPEGGKIFLQTQQTRQGVLLEIRDTGIGIAREKLPLIMDRFYRVEQGKRPGFGLGLSIVSSIIKLHGGQLLIDSELGVGTTVSIRFFDESV